MVGHGRGEHERDQRDGCHRRRTALTHGYSARARAHCANPTEVARNSVRTSPSRQPTPGLINDLSLLATLPLDGAGNAVAVAVAVAPLRDHARLGHQ